MVQEMPKISVVMNCYNGGTYLRHALDSIYAQTISNWEIIFWDNASTDESAAIAQSYDSRLKYYRSPSTTPLGSARNSALRKVTGEYVTFLDTDDKWLPSKLELQLAMMEENPRLGLSHTDVVCYFQSDDLQVRHFDILKQKPARGRVFGHLLRVNEIAMPSVMLRTAALLQQNEWFDERFEIYPDYDLFRRIAYNWECDYIDKPLAIYRVHGTSSSAVNHQRAAWELNETIKKFCGMFPAIHSDYPDEVLYLKVMVAYQRAKSHWRLGEGGVARAIFRQHLNVKKMRNAYWAAFFPYSFVEWLRRKALYRRKEYRCESL